MDVVRGIFFQPQAVIVAYLGIDIDIVVTIDFAEFL
jgi:hypothetical protein